MRVSSSVLPRALHDVASGIGLEYLTHAGGDLSAYPVACSRIPVFDDPVAAISSLPVQMNFAREVLDMDKPEDREEYNRIMTYWRSGYGMHIQYHERRFIRKTYANGKRKIVQRIFIEYYAPYRVLPNDSVG